MSVVDILSVQLYTLRNLGDIDLVLDTVRDAGYRHVELVGSHLDAAISVAEKLRDRGLTASSSHVSLAALRERTDATLAACAALGLKTLYMPAVPPEQRDMDAAGWRDTGTVLATLADRFADHGIELGYHNHDWELRPKDGDLTALDLLFGAADGSKLTWQADVAWLARGGSDPKPWMERFRARITSVHVKDIAKPGNGLDEDGWADVGHGVLDWRDLWSFSRAAGAKWMVVEHDKPRDPAASVRNSFAFLSTLEG
jgi:sugar phosphate isomerase/epimerase